MGLTARKPQEKFTYGDYVNWPDDERWELIDGVPYDMTPAPSRMHQQVSGQLQFQFMAYLRDKPCRIYNAPFDVRMPRGDEPDDDVDTVVQPDLAVVCERDKLDQKGCRGAPDLVVEILSPHTSKKDMRAKYRLYERVGVREYWIVSPPDKTVTVYSLGNDGTYRLVDVYFDGDAVPVGIFQGLSIDLEPVFAD